MFGGPFLYFGVPVLGASATYFFVKLARSGFFDDVQVSITDKVPTLSQKVTFFYKYNVGPYSKAVKIFDEIARLLPEGARTLGIFYDNPEVVPVDRLQSATGCVFAVDGKELYEQRYAKELQRHGFSAMDLPAIDRAVHSRQRFDGMLSLWHLLRHVYPKVFDYVKNERLNTSYTVEVYLPATEKEEGHLDVILPLDHTDGLKVPEYIAQ
ncbi:TAT-4.2 protein [Aphelenchoides avenae]|nr:TAT-4.2 protein [Aphelenchus avenae]